MAGKLFVFEGPDGSGKTTCAKEITKSLNNKYKDLKFENYALPFNWEAALSANEFDEIIDKFKIAHPEQLVKEYKTIRSILRGEKDTEFCTKKDKIDHLQDLMLSNMISTFTYVIKPKLNNGINIILDRWLISTYIYSVLVKGKHSEDYNKILENTNYDFSKVANRVGLLTIPNNIIYFNIPIYLLLNHSISRKTKEENDNIKNVISSTQNYELFFHTLKNSDNYFSKIVINTVDKSEYLNIIEDESSFYSNICKNLITKIENIVTAKDD